MGGFPTSLLCPHCGVTGSSHEGSLGSQSTPFPLLRGWPSLSQLGSSAWWGSCAFGSAFECPWLTSLLCRRGLPGRRSWDNKLCGFGEVPYLGSFLSLKGARPWLSLLETASSIPSRSESAAKDPPEDALLTALLLQPFPPPPVCPLPFWTFVCAVPSAWDAVLLPPLGAQLFSS